MLKAMNEYQASETGEKTPNTVVLSQNIVNSDYASTHQVNVFYPSTAAMDQSLTLNMVSNDWATFIGKLRSASVNEWENMYSGRNLASGNVNGPHFVTLLQRITQR